MRRFRPYISYLKAVRGPIIGALLCGILYGAANGAGLPLMVKMVFPRIFGENAVQLTNTELLLIALWLPTILTVT
jgi:ATP-binding cassette, subfamily B, bacterial MsbA